jgi:hypothetical protein
LIVLAVVNLVALKTFLVASLVLSTLLNPTSDLVKVTAPVFPATLVTAPLALITPLVSIVIFVPAFTPPNVVVEAIGSV